MDWHLVVRPYGLAGASVAGLWRIEMDPAAGDSRRRTRGNRQCSRAFWSFDLLRPNDAGSLQRAADPGFGNHFVESFDVERAGRGSGCLMRFRIRREQVRARAEPPKPVQRPAGWPLSGEGCRRRLHRLC